MEVTAEERREAFEKRWQLGGVLFSKTFPDQMTDLAANEEARKFYEEKIRAVIDDPAGRRPADPRPIIRSAPSESAPTPITFRHSTGPT